MRSESLPPLTKEELLSHQYWMQLALMQAQDAFQADEIPVGAVLVKNNELCLKNHNRTKELNTPLAHAEMLILNEIQALEKYLYDYTLYITLEPCLMCAGAIILSKVGQLVFGALDPKTGVCGSVYNVLCDRRFNHHPSVRSEILASECGQILKNFFLLKRKLEPDQV